MTAALGRLRQFIANDAGATAIEYALLAALLAGAILFSATSMGTTLAGLFSTANAELVEAMPALDP